MLLAEVIIRAHTHVHAAELAVRSGGDAHVIAELIKLHELLNDQPLLKADGACEKTPDGERLYK